MVPSIARRRRDDLNAEGAGSCMAYLLDQLSRWVVASRLRNAFSTVAGGVESQERFASAYGLPSRGFEHAATASNVTVIRKTTDEIRCTAAITDRFEPD